MEQRDVKITYTKSGRGSLTPRVTLPISWIKEMNLSEDDREITISFDGENIIISKKKKGHI